MSALETLIFEVRANAGQAFATFDKLGVQLEKVDAQALAAGGSFDKMGLASKAAGGVLLGVTGVMTAFGYEGIKAALSVASAQANLKTAVENTGVSWKQAQPAVEAMQEKMAGLGFASEDTITALANMTAATRSPAIALQNMGVVADLAAFKHETLAAAADTVSRAAMGQARGLADLGLAINKTIPKGATLAQITQLIADRTKNAAAAAAKADPWKVLTAQFGLMEEKLGTALMPAFEKLTNWLIKDGIPNLEKLGKWISQNIPLLESLGEILATIWIAPKIDAFLGVLAKMSKAWGGVTVAAGEAAAAEDAAGASLLALDLNPILGMLAAAGVLLTLISGMPQKDTSSKMSPAGGSVSGTAINGPSFDPLHASLYPPAATSKTAKKTIDPLSASYLSTLQGKEGSLSSIMAAVAALEKTAGGKTSIKKAEKGITTYSTSSGLNVSVQIDGTQATIKSIKYGNTKTKQEGQTMTTVSSLSPYQFAFNGWTFGAGTNYPITRVQGLAGLPDLRVQDDNRGYTDGMYSGRDFYGGRTVTIDMIIVGNSGTSAQSYYNTLQANLYPQQSGTPSNLGAFQFELSSAAGLKIMYGRVRKIETTIDPEFTYGYIQTSVEFFFPDPRYYDYPSSSGSGTTVAVTNSGWATSCPVITIASPPSNVTFWIATAPTSTGLTSSSPSMEFLTASTSSITVDLLQKTVTQNGNPARNILLGSTWLSIPANTPSNFSFYSTEYVPGMSGSVGPSMSISYTDAYV